MGPVGREDEEPEVLTKFKNKYMPFFVEDYRWTSHNYDDMAKRSPEFERWWKLVSPIRDELAAAKGGSRLETVEEFAIAIDATDELDGRELVQRALQRLFETKLAPAFRANAQVNAPGIVRRNALGR
jgi:hypothetical protein